jgi:hypothetical protein
MSRNPYLASSRPTSSFTRSSRTSNRTGVGVGGGGALLGRSRSSATLGGLASQLASSNTSGTNPYAGSSSLSVGSSHYVPSSAWQRSSSSTRLGASTVNNRASSPLTTTGTAKTSNNQYKDDNDNRRANSLYRSTSSHSLNRTKNDDDDREIETNVIITILFRKHCCTDSSNAILSLFRPKTNHNLKLSRQPTSVPSLQHLKNYQQSKSNQPQPTRSTLKSNRLSSQSIDTDNSSTDNNESFSRATTRSTTSLESTATGDDYEDSSIGDSIPSGSARHLRQQQQQQQQQQQHGNQLFKSKSLEISSSDKAGDGQETSLLFSTMSVDRLLLRADSMGERDLRKSFKELVMENERLKQQLKGYDDKDKQKQQEWIRKERQLQRKISELEEENKQIEHWKQEIQRLKDENNSLIRVVSKLSKQP